MKKNALYFILILSLSLSCGRSGAKTTQNFDAGVREPAVAGQFYPADSSRLKAAVTYYLEDGVKASGEKPVAIISPHAGYVYSAQIAADAFHQAAGHDYDLIIVLGVNHTVPGFTGVSIYPGDYQTPLGVVKTDEDAAKQLVNAGDDFVFDAAVHTREHSIEVQLPFVQMLFPNAKIIPAVVGAPDLDLCTRFAEALANIAKARRALIVASSDLSHYPVYEDAVKADKNTLDAVLTMDPNRFLSVIKNQEKQGIPNLSTCACGQAAILTAMIAAKNLGAVCGRLVSYANSGDAPVGSHDRVVGYGAVSFSADKNCNAEKSESGGLSQEHKKALLSFARKTIEQFLNSETIPPARGFDPILENRQGAFVTLKKHGELRGCIGHMAEDLPLCQVVGMMALQAAFNDPRFTPVKLSELPEIEIEISVLTPSQKVKSPEDIVIGRDGVILRKDGRSAVFLPQVAPEQGWNIEEMLSHLSRKAGLSSDSWKKDAEFYTFQAVAFSESDLK
jgi:AmmeMemoRadiSam system protein B/AmmeMemoRadiSam system protein A